MKFELKTTQRQRTRERTHTHTHTLGDKVLDCVFIMVLSQVWAFHVMICSFFFYSFILHYCNLLGSLENAHFLLYRWFSTVFYSYVKLGGRMVSCDLRINLFASPRTINHPIPILSSEESLAIWTLVTSKPIRKESWWRSIKQTSTWVIVSQSKFKVCWQPVRQLSFYLSHFFSLLFLSSQATRACGINNNFFFVSNLIFYLTSWTLWKHSEWTLNNRIFN